jgi:hypothetical protein
VLQAELHGKTSSRGDVTDEDKLEDTLTSDVLGAMRYLPRHKVLKALLQRAFPFVPWSDAGCRAARFEFWPAFADGTEPDVVLTIDRRLIVVEAKYGAAFGRRQLLREWTGGEKVAASRGLQEVLLLTVTKDLGGEPGDVRAFRGQLNLGPRVAHLSWQEVGRIIDEAKLDTPEADALASDVLAVMERRGVRFVYTGIDEADWWTVCAAQRVASARVYPQIAALARQLQENLEPDGIRWGVSEDRILTYGSLGVGSPASWARSYIQLPFWPKTWPTAGRGNKWWATLQVLFDFLNAVVSIGYLTRPGYQTEAKSKWVPAATQLLGATASLDDAYVLTVTYGDYARVEESKHPSQWTVEEFANQLARPGCHLVVERRLSLDRFTGASQARDLLLETVEAVEKRPSLLVLPSGSAPGSGVSSTGEIADDAALETTETSLDDDTPDDTLT